MIRRALIPIGVLVALGGFALSLLKGDGCGPVERGIRAGLGTWDMWSTASVSPFELPQADAPEGSVPVGGEPGVAQARRQLNKLTPGERAARAAVLYRRFCQHCHGPNGDGRVIVGESFPFALPDLRAPAVQSLADERLFERLQTATARMISLAPMMSVADRLLVIEEVRRFRNRPSHPFFPRQWVEPAERPGGPR